MDFFFIGLVIGLVAVAAWIARRSVFVVHEGECAILTVFGQPIGGETPQIWGPGLHFRVPWAGVHRVPNKQVNLRAAWDESESVLGHDGAPLKIDATVRYQVVPEQASKFLFGVDHGHDHLAELFECLVRSAVAAFGPAEGDPTAFARLRRERRALVADLSADCQAQLAHTYGVSFVGVDVAGITPPKELEEALNAVLEAGATARARLSDAAAECEQRVVAAEQGVEVAREESRAAADEMSRLATILGELARAGTLGDYVRHRRAEILNQSKTVFVRSEE